MTADIKMLAKEANSTEWHFLVKRKLGVLANSLIWKGLNRDCYTRAIGIDFSHDKGFYFGMDWHITKDAFEQETAIIREMDEKDDQALKRLAHRCYDLGRQLMEFTDDVTGTDFSERTTDELFALFEEYSRKLGDFLPFLIFTHPVANYLEAATKQEIKKLLALKEKDDAFEHICAVSFAQQRKNDINIEHEEFLKLALKLKENPSLEIDEALRQHKEKHSWFPARDGMSELTSLEEYRERLGELISSDPGRLLAQLEAFREENELAYKEFLLDFDVGDLLRNRIETAREYIYLRTYRTDRIYHSLCNMRGLLRELGSRFGLEWIHMAHLTVEDVLSLKERIPSKEEVDERIREFAYIVINGNMHVLSGKVLEEFKKDYAPDHVPHLNELEGNVASPGRAVGKAKIVISIQDIGKVESGDVLVASMTTPDYVPAMNKASAFVTDEGGITCHAAIVAREMKKPCVIATKFGTKILKDGDMVEVDADKGIIRKISQ